MTHEQMDLSTLFPKMDLSDIGETSVALYLIEGDVLKPATELRMSMDQRGQLQPVILNRRGAKPNSYRIVDGRRRISAARDLGWDSIRAYIFDVDPLVEASLAVTMNGVRSANPVSDMRAIRELVDAGYPERDIAQATGLRVNVIRKRMKLASLRPALFNGVLAGKVAIGVAERAASMPQNVQDGLVGRLAETGRLTGKDVREANQVSVEAALEEMADLFAATPEPVPPPETDAERTLQQVAGELSVILRTYEGSLDLADWRVVADRAWFETFGEVRGAA